MKKNSTLAESKELVTLRKKPLKGGGFSLLLDYTIDGVRIREFLKMYLTPGETKLQRIQNDETLKVANALKAKKIIELQEGRAGLPSRKRTGDVPFIDFVEERKAYYIACGKPDQIEKLKKLQSRLKKYGKNTTLCTINNDYILDFCRNMRNSGLAEGTVFVYFSTINTLLNRACRSGRIYENPIRRMDVHLKPKQPESVREYLTLDELKVLSKTPCGNKEVKRAFLFACFTGLRISDIEALQWPQIQHGGNGYQIERVQKKTKKMVYAPLSANAIQYLPQKWEKSGPVFSMPSRVQTGDNLKKWISRAGITKRITFHCSRHTYATLLLTYGADLYTVSKLLGHADIATTQIYAKIVDEKKRQAVDLIPTL